MPERCAGCGLGGRFDVSGATEIGHWTATTVASILLIADTPAVTQRIGIVVATVWLAVFAGATLVRRVKG